jgi:hypothetical protein
VSSVFDVCESSVPRRESYVPQHRALPTDRPLPTEPPAAPRRSGLRRSLALAGVAVAATTLAVSSGVVLHGDGARAGAAVSASAAGQTIPTDATTGSATGAPVRAVDLGDRDRAPSRSVQRSSVDTAKARSLSQRSGGQVRKTEDLTKRDPRTVARAMLPRFGFGAGQFSCLDSLYTRESGWNVHADNPSSSAYGIPQALPGSKMASAGGNWEDDPATQIRWGLGYIKSRYGTPCGAWAHSQSTGWY